MHGFQFAEHWHSQAYVWRISSVKFSCADCFVIFIYILFLYAISVCASCEFLPVRMYWIRCYSASYSWYLMISLLYHLANYASMDFTCINMLDIRCIHAYMWHMYLIYASYMLHIWCIYQIHMQHIFIKHATYTSTYILTILTLYVTYKWSYMQHTFVIYVHLQGSYMYNICFIYVSYAFNIFYLHDTCMFHICFIYVHIYETYITYKYHMFSHIWNVSLSYRLHIFCHIRIYAYLYDTHTRKSYMLAYMWTVTYMPTYMIFFICCIYDCSVWGYNSQLSDHERSLKYLQHSASAMSYNFIVS